ncbi:GNAT family N-acetyltransferase [Alginatibacterium sediminis]|uniref:GNAT family N-acetyltransferase n=1 Tax=Alginatibacterium sediminis TaxID=2164068 RepID=A0A420E7Q1_9ALTE|nr:GNAT family N-acetyltransferase [Alginatibacterium sediminis]RKF15569.1 GNAT family N-acetyltransferase [Alginatibacterium sediminis]
MKESCIYYLEMLNESELKAKTESYGLLIVEMKHKQWQFNRFLYELVGSAWQWTDKLSWSEKQWQNYVDNDLFTWVAYMDGAVAGYFELQLQHQKQVEIRYFGLSEPFIGRGLGGYLLSEAISKAWSLNDCKRVWVHTCSDDHPSALTNYMSRGFSQYHCE